VPRALAAAERLAEERGQAVERWVRTSEFYLERADQF
jgi:hypothetical protein